MILLINGLPMSADVKNEAELHGYGLGIMAGLGMIVAGFFWILILQPEAG